MTDQTTVQAGGTLAAFGTFLANHRRTIQTIQWGMVVLYLGLLVWPVFLPLPDDYATFRSDMVLFAQFVFWGVWWPFVMVSMVLFGRLWCGVFCPEGALTEWASRRGLGLPIPKWIRWPGWPFVAFVSTTVYGQMVTVYEYPKAALLVLGGSTVAAIAIGLLFGRGKRVWCRYLCPANGVFGLLSRVAPLHFQVDPEAWRNHPRTPAVDCPTLVDVRQMKGNGACHMCGRCSGHRGAVHLASRSVNKEIPRLPPREVSSWDAALILFGVLGVATGAFQWSSSPWFVWLKAKIAGALIGTGWSQLLSASLPWWILTNYPETGEVFSVLDGIALLAYILGTAALIGLAFAGALKLAGLVAGGATSVARLAYCFVPLGGIGLFLGLSTITLGALRTEGWIFPGTPTIRAGLLAASVLWSAWLLWCALPTVTPKRKLAAWGTALAGCAPYTSMWISFFFVW